MIFTKSEVNDVQKALIRADLTMQANLYLTLSLLTSIILSLAVGSVSYLAIKFDLTTSFVITALSFAAFALILKRVPKLLAKARAASIESDLPIAVRAMAIQLNMKMPFEAALQNTADAPGWSKS